MQNFKDTIIVLVKLVPAIFFALLAGFTRSFYKKEHTFYGFLRCLVLSAFVGIIIGLTCQNYDISGVLTYLYVSIGAICAERVIMSSESIVKGLLSKKEDIINILRK